MNGSSDFHLMSFPHSSALLKTFQELPQQENRKPTYVWPGIFQLTHLGWSPTHSHSPAILVFFCIPSTWNSPAHLGCVYSSFRSLRKKSFPPGKLAWFDSLGQGYLKGSPQSRASPNAVCKEISTEMEKAAFRNFYGILILPWHLSTWSVD